MRSCTKCHEAKPEEEYHWKKKGVKRNSRCKTCQRAAVKAHYDANTKYYTDKAAVLRQRTKEERRRLIAEYLSTHPCVDCGLADIVVLQFDHRDPSEKTSTINHMRMMTATSILAEIQKCDVRCANCHTRRTAVQQGWWQLNPR